MNYLYPIDVKFVTDSLFKYYVLACRLSSEANVAPDNLTFYLKLNNAGELLLIAVPIKTFKYTSNAYMYVKIEPSRITTKISKMVETIKMYNKLTQT